MNESEKQFSFTRAAPVQAGAPESNFLSVIGTDDLTFNTKKGANQTIVWVLKVEKLCRSGKIV